MRIKKTVPNHVWKKKPFKERLVETRKILKTLSFPEKISYIWSYYYGWILFAIGCVLLILALFGTVHGINTKAIYMVFCDTPCADEEVATLRLNEAFRNYLGDQADRKDMIKVDTSLSFRDELSDYQLKLMEQKFSGEMQANAIDILVGRYNTIISFGELGMFEDLTKVLDPELLKKLEEQDLLFNCTIPASEEDGTPELTYCCGIHINTLDPNLLAMAGFEIDENTCIGIPYGARRQERAIQFIEMLLSQM